LRGYKHTKIKTASEISKVEIAPKATVPPLSKDQIEKFLAKAPEEHVFWSTDGRILRDMKDLKDALTAMSEQTFVYHSNDVKKDFSKWTRDILGDEKLAKDLEAAANREEAARIAAERLAYLNNQLG
jgi:hypothetical protein